MKKINKKVSGGIRISWIDVNSPAFKSGLRKNDIVIAVNGEPVKDELDFTFYTACENIEIQVRRKSKENDFVINRKSGEFLGIEFARTPIRRCRNKCIFCFIDQLPAGMRKRLYVKDEDYRYSFLNGNYITLSSLTVNEMNRIVKLGLSPLYISVHATDSEVRKKMLRNPHAGRIMEQLKEIQDNGIAFHTQIVVCPGINDGPVLEKSIHDLLTFKESLLSIAVVPVGLTKHRKTIVRPVSPRGALRVCNTVLAMSEKDKEITGFRRLFIADEFLLMGGITIPSYTYYEDYPQIENGVGLIRLLLQEWRSVKEKLQRKRGNITSGKVKRNTRYLLLTSVSARPFLEMIVSELGQFFKNINIIVEPVINRFFGESVTVAGLTTARDIMYSIRKYNHKADEVIVPQVILNYNGYTLDGFSVDRIIKNTGVNVVAVENLSHLVEYISKGKDEQ
jgi:putative radical SAM enzyme (TIGR03279 family)